MVSTFVLFGVFWVGMCILWSPFLLSTSIRTLFERWPTGGTGVNYVFWMGVVIAGYVATGLKTLFAIHGTEPVDALTGAKTILGITAVYAAAVTLLVGGWLPRRGIWTPGNGDLDGRIVLAVGAIWFTACVGVALAILLFIVFLIGFPG